MRSDKCPVCYLAEVRKDLDRLSKRLVEEKASDLASMALTTALGAVTTAYGVLWLYYGDCACDRDEDTRGAITSTPSVQFSE